MFYSAKSRFFAFRVSEWRYMTVTCLSELLFFEPAGGGVVDFVENFFCGGLLREILQFPYSRLVFSATKNRRVRKVFRVTRGGLIVDLLEVCRLN